MKSTRYILTGAIAAACASIAQADTTVYITGSTAYRGSTVLAIETLFGGPGTFKCVFGAKTGVSNEQGATHSIFQGPVAGLGTVTVKCAWGGSVGGLQIIDDPVNLNINSQPGVTGWIPTSLLPVGNTVTGIAESLISFESGATADKADAAFTDAFQETVGITSLIPNGTTAGVTDGKVGVIVFEWVVGNGVGFVVQISANAYAANATQISYNLPFGGGTPVVGRNIGGKGIKPGTTITAIDTVNKIITISQPTVVASTAISLISCSTNVSAPLKAIDHLKARAVLGGGAYTSQFTGVEATTNALNSFVYAFGRNADSGTRVSCLAETGFGVASNPVHVQPTIENGTAGGKGGLAASKILSMALWPAETVLGVPYATGRSGYSGGGDLAGALTSWGSFGAPTTSGGTALPFQSKVGKDGGYMIGYLGRNDAEKACAQTSGSNTAHRLSWNGQIDWKPVNANSPTDYKLNFTHDGKPINGYADANVTSGLYTAWEWEHFYRNAGADADADKKAYLDTLANSIISGDPGTNNVGYNLMKVNRASEGGVITHITTP